MSRTTGPRAGARRRAAKTILRIVFVVAVLGFGVAYVIARWRDVAGVMAALHVPLTLVAFGLVIVALVFAMLSWRALWPAFGARLSILQAANVFWISQLGKYIPGSVWPIAAQAQMAKEVGLLRSASVLLSLVNLLVAVATGVAVGLLLVPFIEPGLLPTLWPLIPVAALLLLCLAPPVLTAVVRRLLSVLRKSDAPHRFTAGVVGRASALQLTTWLSGGLQLWVIAIALGADPLATLVPSIAAFPLAFAVGILAVPVPAGVGVREFVIVLILGAFATEPLALTAALVSRLLYVVADFCVAGAAAIAGRVDRARHRAADSAAFSHRRESNDV